VTGLLGSAFVIQFAVFLGCLPVPRLFQPLLGLIGLGAAVMGLIGGIVLSAVTVQGEWYWFQLGFVGTFVMILVSIPLGVGLFFILSVVVLSPRSANRALPARVYLTAVWALAFVGVAVWSVLTKENVPVLLWMFFSVSLFSLALAVSVSERETLGPRVARTIPRRRWLRPAAFLFYSGSAGGAAWSSLTLGLTVLLAWIWHFCFPEFGPRIFTYDIMPLFIAVMGGIGLYAFCYCMTAVFIRRIFFPRISPAYTCAIAILVAGTAFAVGGLGCLFSKDAYDYSYAYGIWHIANPLILAAPYGEEYGSLGLGFAGLWAVLVAILNRSWFYEQVKAFRPCNAQGGAAR